MLDKIAKGAKTLPGATMLIAAAVAGGVGTAYALNDDGDEGTVTIEQVASEPTASETVAPAPVVATSEPAPVVTPEPVVSTTAPAPEETTVAPKPEPKPRLALIPDSRGPEYPPTDPNTAAPPAYPEDTAPAPEPYRPPAD